MASLLDGYYSTVTRSQYVKCPKHPGFDLLYVCLEASCHKRGSKCKECLAEEHLGHKNILLTEFISSMKCVYIQQEESFAQVCRNLKIQIDREYDVLVQSFRGVITDLEQKSKEILSNIKVDLRYFWRAVDENPPFLYKKNIEKIESNSVHSQKVLQEMVLQLLNYYHNKTNVESFKSIINSSFDEALKTLQYNQEKVNLISRKITSDVSALILERIKKPEPSHGDVLRGYEPKTYVG
jgi:hypothetical protein